MNKWIRKFPTVLLSLSVLLAAGCVSLPGENSAAPARYTLQGIGQDCTRGTRILALSVVRVASGLDSDRVAIRNPSNGEYTYLKGVRWVDSAGAMLEQRMASDLECRGFVVQTGHRARSGQGQLLCELRSLNLLRGEGITEAEVSLSCIYHQSSTQQERALLDSARVPMRGWTAPLAIEALSEAYRKTILNLVQKLE